MSIEERLQRRGLWPRTTSQSPLTAGYLILGGAVAGLITGLLSVWVLR